MSSARIRTLALLLALSPCAARGGTLSGHSSPPAAPSEAAEPQPLAKTPHAPATPVIAGRSEAEWRDGALARQRELESARAALAACEVREAPAPYHDYAGYYRPAARPRDGYRWVAIKNCDDARLDLRDAHRDLEDFEEQARTSAVPPGWLR